MLGMDFVIADIYQGICLYERSLLERVNDLCRENHKLKNCLSVYERLALLVTGKSLTGEIRKVYEVLEEGVCDELENAGVCYMDFKTDKNYAMRALMALSSTKDGYEGLKEAYEEIEDIYIEKSYRLRELASLQRRLAEMAFEAEKLQNGVDFPCLDIFLRQMEKEQETKPFPECCEVCMSSTRSYE